jgi:DNA-binding phage protein
MAIKMVNGRMVYEPNPGPIQQASAKAADNIRNFVGGLFGGQSTTSNVNAVTGAGVGPISTGSNPPKMLEKYFKDQAEEQQIASGTYGNVGSLSDAISGLQNKLLNNSMQNQLSGGNKNLTSGNTSNVVTGSSTSGVVTPTFNPTASTTDWTAKLAGVTVSGKELNQKTLDALKENINTQYTEQLKAIQTQAKQGQLAEQQARQQIAEAAFTRERQLLEAASQRGLGGSGLEQLSKVQQRTVVGQQINQLAQQTGLQREQLTNALSQAAAAKNAALTQAEINALTTQLQLDQADFQQGLSLDDRNRAQAYQKFQADLASAEFTNQTEYIQWQKDNAKEQAKLLGVRNKQDALAVLADPNASEDFKKAWIKLNLDAGFITEQEATEWGAKNLKSVNPEEVVNTNTDYTSVLSTKAIDIIVQSGRSPIEEGFIQEREALDLNWQYTGPDGKVYNNKGSVLIDKNNPESIVYAFKDLPGYSARDEATNMDIIQPKISGGKIKFAVWYPSSRSYVYFNTFKQASDRYQRDNPGSTA